MQGRGDLWAVNVLDVDSRGIVVKRHGRRDGSTLHPALAESRERLAAGLVPSLVSTDRLWAYTVGLFVCCGQTDTAPCLEKRSPSPIGPDPRLTYVMVDKQRDTRGQVRKVEPRLVFGSEPSLAQSLAASTGSKTVNTAFVERYHGKERGFNPRLARQAQTFSKKAFYHAAIAWWGVASHNFCWTPARKKGSNERPATPAMRGEIASAPLRLEEIARLRPPGFRAPTRRELARGDYTVETLEPQPASMAHWPGVNRIRESLARLGIKTRDPPEST